MVDTLHQQIHDQSWSGEHFGRNGMLRKAKRRFQSQVAEGDLIGALSALSSSYYTAAGNALSRWRLGEWKVWWLVIAMWCGWQAKKKSDEFAKLVSTRDMTSGQACVRSSILIGLKRYEVARKLLDFMLDEETLLDDDRVLLLINRAKIAEVKGHFDFARELFGKALAFEKRIKTTTLVRLYRSFAEFLGPGNIVERDRFLALAKELVGQKGMGDQRLKFVATKRN